MTLQILYAGAEKNWPVYQDALHRALQKAGVDAALSNTFSAPESVDYIVYAPTGPVQDFTPFTSLKAVLSLWAGVETFAHNETLKVPLTRMADSGLREGMVEWVTGHVLRHHLGMDSHVLQQDGVWRNGTVPPLARDRRVGILGLGALGLACASALAALNFRVSGWSRRQKDVTGIKCFSGDDGLETVLSTSEILVLLVPLTGQTENIVNRRTLSLLPEGAVVINPGRGALIDDTALLDALDSGQVAHATLDVFREEPLPISDPYWAHPKVTVTPHIASDTRPSTAAEAIVENIRRFEAGKPLLNLVDRASGY